MNKTKNKKGFTLIELLVVISIIGILTIISLASFTNAQIKARDAQRKSDLGQVSKALMMYYSDTGTLPADFEFGDEDGFNGSNNIIYMRKTPKDPKNSDDYVYVYKTNGNSFNLFANLENKNDSQCSTSPYTVDGDSYCYAISSPNAVVKNWP